jgi:hypothetical protein
MGHAATVARRSGTRLLNACSHGLRDVFSLKGRSALGASRCARARNEPRAPRRGSVVGAALAHVGALPFPATSAEQLASQ